MTPLRLKEALVFTSSHRDKLFLTKNNELGYFKQTYATSKTDFNFVRLAKIDPSLAVDL